MPTESQDIAEHLETHLRENGVDRLIHYSDLAASFDDLPPMSGAWRSHPLCQMFDQLDREDAAAERPFRTAIVVNRENFQPGNGFFESYSRYVLDGRRIAHDERIAIHTSQLAELRRRY